MKIHKFIIFVILAICASFMLQKSATAQSTGVSVSPAFIEGSVSESSKQYVAQITLTNNYLNDITLQPSFNAIDESTGAIVPGGALTSDFTNSLTLSDKSLTIPANSSKIITLTFINTKELLPGGHYGVLSFTEENIPKKSSLKTSLAVGMFMVKKDGETSKTELTIKEDQRNIFSLPKLVHLEFKNVGNVHVTPRAAVLAMKGADIVKKGTANSRSVRVLPGKTYTEDVPLLGVKNVWMPGKIHLVIMSRFDGSSAVEERTMSYMYVPPRFFILVAIAVLVLYIFKKLFRYRRPIARYIKKRVVYLYKIIILKKANKSSEIDTNKEPTQATISVNADTAEPGVAYQEKTQPETLQVAEKGMTSRISIKVTTDKEKTLKKTPKQKKPKKTQAKNKTNKPKKSKTKA